MYLHIFQSYFISSATREIPALTISMSANYFASSLLFVNAIIKQITIQMIHATFPFVGTAPATTSFVSGFSAVPLAASPKLWQIAAPMNIPTTVIAESEDP